MSEKERGKTPNENPPSSLRSSMCLSFCGTFLLARGARNKVFFLNKDHPAKQRAGEKIEPSHSGTSAFGYDNFNGANFHKYRFLKCIC